VAEVEEVSPASREEPGDDLFHETSIGRQTIPEAAHQIIRIANVGREVVIAVVEEAEGLPVVLLERFPTSRFESIICRDQNNSLCHKRKNITTKKYHRRKRRTSMGRMVTTKKCLRMTN
jgi:hypothetical protein